MANARPQSWEGSTPRWSPAGDWIAYPAADGIDLISPDGKSTRNLTSRKFLAYGFSKDGSQFYGIFQNTTGNGAQWQLYSVNVKTRRREISGAHRSFRFRGSYGRIQHPSRRQALPHLRGQVPVRYLDAGRLRAAGAKELSGSAAASLRCKRLRLSSTTMCGCEASPILSGSSDTRRMG